MQKNHDLIRQELYRQPVCVTCSNKIGKVVRLCVKRNGVFIPYGHALAQVGDLLACPVCHTEIVHGYDILDRIESLQVLDSEYAILRGVKDLPI
jgi:hypothetical protein